MPLKTPEFWYRGENQPTPIMERLLSPFSSIYALGHHLNISRQKTQKANIPVICVGNITAGGSGKTPTILALHKIITDNNLCHAPYFLTRAYGANDTSTRIISGHNSSNDAGDEPKILASHSKTIISVNRYDGAITGHDDGADCILMDDGFQNNTLYKDFSFLVFDGAVGIGNGKLLPAGPLRETLQEGLERAQGVIIIGEDKREISYDIKSLDERIPVFGASITPSSPIDKNHKYIAFAGLGRPQKFHDTLLEHNAQIINFIGFPDHHQYTESEINKLLEKAHDQEAKLITTEKDFVKIASFGNSADIDVMKVRLSFNDEQAIIECLRPLFV